MATNKKTRDEAVLLLNALASRRNTRSDTGIEKDGSDVWGDLNFFGMADQLETSTEALALARDCFDHVPSLHACISHQIDDATPHAFELECAQAAQLVEEGWEKGNEIKERTRIQQELDAGIETHSDYTDELEGLN